MGPKAYLFDMDHTLINNDCDVSWKDFLIEKGVAPKSATETAEMFFQQYKQNCLDMSAFLNFQLKEFEGKTVEEMKSLAQEHFETFVKDKIYEQGREAVEAALATGKPVALLTATNRILATPLAENFNIPTVLAFDVKNVDGKYLPEPADEISHGAGKIDYAKAFLAQFGIDIKECAYYGDSTSDIPILSAVGFPNPVNPSDELKATAEANNWQILNFV